MDISHVVGVVAVFAMVWLVALYQLPVLVWTVMLGLGLITLSVLGFLSPVFMILFWLLYLLATAFANLKLYRQKHLIQPALGLLKQKLPGISNTEREAIEAGNTWWEKELFCGRPKWQTFFNIAKPTLSSEEQSFLDNQVETLCAMLNDWQIVHVDKNLPESVWAYLKKERFLGMIIPKEYGGLGFSALAHSTIIVKIASRSISAAVNTMVPNSLGPAELLLHYGTEEQKNHYLPRLASGDEIPCFALTSTDAGSDAGAMPDKGVVCRGQYEGKETIGIRLSWDKRYITLAPVATLLGVAFHLYDPNHLMGDVEDIGITLCLIPTNHPGVEVGNRHLPLMLAFMNGPTRGRDVFIPLEFIIGGEEMAGQGWRMLMECLSVGRAISLPALSTASAKLTYRYTGAYAKVRRQFNLPIASFEGVGEALGYISGNTYMLESCRLLTAGAVDLQVKPSIASAIAKYHMTELARQVVMHGMDVHAGHMIQMGPRNFLGNIYISMPISVTVEGANILTRNLIIFGQGAIRCHPYLLSEIELISAPVTNIEELDKVLMSHIGYFVSNLVRTIGNGLTGGIFIRPPMKNRRIRALQKQVTRMSTVLALLSDASVILLGGSLKRRERVSARLGDIMSQLYLASSVLKYYVDNGQPDTDVDYVCWCLQSCLAKTQVAIDELLVNFPQKWIGVMLRFLVFPFGRSYYFPSDRLHEKITEPMLSPSALRDRITKDCYLSKDESEIFARLDKALTLIPSVEQMWKKIQLAVQQGAIAKTATYHERINLAVASNILTADEARQLHEYDALKNEIIKVNEFSFDLKTVIA